MPSRFILYCVPRTGSYYLMSLLNSAPDLVCHGEAFKEHRVEIIPWHRRKLGDPSVEDRDRAPLDFITNLVNLNPRKHSGFKLFHNHVIRVPALEALLADPSWKKIVLLRSPLEIYASLLRVRLTDVWTLPKDRERPDADLLAKVVFTPASLDPFAATYNAFLSSVSEQVSPEGRFIIHYDQLDDTGARDAMLSFLGSKAGPKDLAGSYEKQYRGDLSEAFENWSELVDYVEKTRPFASLPEASQSAFSKPQ